MKPPRLSSTPPSRLRLVEEPYEEVGVGDVELSEELTDADVLVEEPDTLVPEGSSLYFGIKLPLLHRP